jgi:hypothetical protein
MLLYNYWNSMLVSNLPCWNKNTSKCEYFKEYLLI